MGQTYQSTVINAPAEKVWNAIRNFHDLSWAPNLITLGLSILISLTLGAFARWATHPGLVIQSRSQPTTTGLSGSQATSGSCMRAGDPASAITCTVIRS